MNNKTEGVTLDAGFVLDLLGCYEKNRSTFARGLFEMAPEIDPDDLAKPLPIQLYNDMCQWIEDNLGAASLRKAGVAIGSRAYDKMVESDAVGQNPTPLEIMKGLQYAASVMIFDPEKRGWEILRTMTGCIIMRRTQTFNCVLQEGLLKSLVERSGVSLPGAEHIACTRQGAEFCDYAVTWMT